MKYCDTDIVTAYHEFYKGLINTIYGTGRPVIKNVIFNNPATIVFWHDGTKTVVKCQEGDDFDPEKGLTMAIAKKFFGNRGSYNNVINKWVDKYYEEQFDATEMLKNITFLIQKKDCNVINKWIDKYYEKRSDATNACEALKQERIRRDTEAAYMKLVEVANCSKSTKADLHAAMEEAIGYLGAALE